MEDIQVLRARQQPPTVAEKHRFLKEHVSWYIDLPGYAAEGLTKQDLHLRKGTAALLDWLGSGSRALTLLVSTTPFEGAMKLELLGPCRAGGGIYLLEDFEGTLLWICDLALFVFGDTPPLIYLIAQ